jgi:hypothetical protein
MKRYCLLSCVVFFAFAVGARAEPSFFTFDGSNRFSASKGAPEGASKLLSKARDTGADLKCFAFALSGEWVFLFGHDGFYTSNTDLPACKKLTELQKQNADLKCVAFAPSGGGWTILWDQNGIWLTDCRVVVHYPQRNATPAARFADR